jgi:UDP-N-acetylmuramate dehydrogenase
VASAAARAAAALGPLATLDAPLGARTTYRVGGRAAVAAEVSSPDDLEQVHEAVVASGLPVLVVGKGSNLLVADAGVPGVVVSLGPGFESVEIRGSDVVAGGAAALPVVARRTAAAGLTGLEWAVGVPGSVGGAVRMNAGGHGSDVAATLRSIRAFDLRTGEHGPVTAEALALGYRRSAVAPETVVVEATFGLRPGSADDALAEVAGIVRWRREHQPGGQNAGSVFTNPAGDSAGRLVEAAGCRGLRLRSAQVSPKHANFIQADPGGSADDVLALIRLVADRVAASCGAVLTTEVRLVGFGPDPRSEVEG